MDRYAVVGNPIAHSKSPYIHQQFAAQTQQSLQYDRMLVEPKEFANAAHVFFASGGCGLNVTVPFKEDAFRFAQRLTPRAEAAGAVNTLAMQNGTILGDNTDGAGLVADLRAQRWPLSGRILLLGAGGAVRGVVQPLLAQNPQSLTIANRTLAKAKLIAEHFAERVGTCTYAELEGAEFDVIINGTSASLAGDLPPVPGSVFRDTVCVYDMMYGAEPTPFLRSAAEIGVTRLADGLGMLVEQAAEAFYLWRGVRPQTAPVLQSLRESLR